MEGTDQSLLRPDLWELLLPAVKAARTAGRAYAADNKYVPRQPLTEYRQNDAGWPVGTKDRSFSAKTDLIDWTELFSLTTGRFTEILVADVPELAAAVQELSHRALTDDDLLRGLSILAPLITEPRDEDEVRGQVEFETVRRFIGTLLNRADAIGAESDDELRAIYQQMELARFAKELTGDIIIPLVAVAFEGADPVQIDGNAWLERLTEADHRVRALSWMERDVSPWVAAGATHAVVVRAARFPNTVRDARPSLPFDLFENVARMATEAAHLVVERSTGYAQVLVRPNGWAKDWMLDLPPLWSAWTGRAYPEGLNSRYWDDEMTLIDAVQTAEITKVARALLTAPKNVKMAARRYRRTAFRDSAEDQVLDVAIGIEALVGKEVDALTHRMAQRAAIALADRIPPAATYDLLKQFYNIRSKIAHGDEPKSWTVKLGDGKYNGVETGMFLLRELLLNRLLADKPWNAESLDKQMLERFERPEGYRPAEDDEADIAAQ